MGQKFQKLRRVEATRLFLFAGLVSILIASFQYVNVRYGSIEAFTSSSSSDHIATVNSLSSPIMYPIPEKAEERRVDSDAELIIDSQKKGNLGLHSISIQDGTDKNNPNLETGSSPDEKLPSPFHALPPEDLPTIEAPSENDDSDADYEKKESDRLVHEVKNLTQVWNSGVVSISQIMTLLHQSHDSNVSTKPRWVSPADKDLSYARKKIRNPTMIDTDPLLYAPLYWNLSTFKRSYELMEKMLKIYVYREGKRPIMHKPVLKGIYASEGWFMRQLKSSNTFVTKNPRKAHLFYLPFNSKRLEETLYVPGSHSDENLIKFLKSYLNTISTKYSFWNRTEGSDHFLVACHDWAPSETRKYMEKCIRALCNSDVTEGFVVGKDVALPETTIRFPRRPLRALGGKPPSQRLTLAFFAGGMHGYVRPRLLQHWGGNKDPDMKIFRQIPKSKDKKSYIEHMKSSKYCICPKGYEVNSPRVVEAIFYECVPVIISDNFVPPFFEVLNWESFVVFVMEKDIPNLKSILQSITDKKYREIQMNVQMVQKHFLWHPKPEKYDIFHMILHSLWYSRVFQS